MLDANDLLKIGVVGYSGRPFDHDLARRELRRLLLPLAAGHDSAHVELVSGHTDVGVPRLAYLLAEEMGWTTIGISAAEAATVKEGLYPVDRAVSVGEKFGDESEAFLAYIDVLVRVGGGKQSIHEVARFREIHAGEKLEELLFEADI